MILCENRSFRLMGWGGLGIYLLFWRGKSRPACPVETFNLLVAASIYGEDVCTLVLNLLAPILGF